jgi:hypothetical protein
MRRAAAVLTLLFLAGCATEHKVYGPDGREDHAISCDGAVLSWASCLDKAGEICGAKGYDVIDKGEETRTLVGAPAVYRHMMIACKP